jgi:hypothetical protein
MAPNREPLPWATGPGSGSFLYLFSFSGASHAGLLLAGCRQHRQQGVDQRWPIAELSGLSAEEMLDLALPLLLRRIFLHLINP